MNADKIDVFGRFVMNGQGVDAIKEIVESAPSMNQFPKYYMGGWEEVSLDGTIGAELKMYDLEGTGFLASFKEEGGLETNAELKYEWYEVAQLGSELAVRYFGFDGASLNSEFSIYDIEEEFETYLEEEEPEIDDEDDAFMEFADTFEGRVVAFKLK